MGSSIGKAGWGKQYRKVWMGGSGIGKSEWGSSARKGRMGKAV